MRDNIQNCYIECDGSPLSNEFIWSLRYSTHSHYFVKNPTFNMKEYIFLNEFIEGDTEFLREINVSIKDGEINFGGIRKLFLEGISSFGLPLVDNPNFRTGLPKSVSFFLLSDFEEQLSLLGAIDKVTYDILDHRLNPFILELAETVISYIKDNFKLSPNIFFGLTISTDSKGVLIEVLKTIDVYDIRALRSAGINIPLIIIQNLLLRKIGSHKFINDISFEQLEKPQFKGNFDTIYFDLDETIIWEGKPIVELVTFLKSAYNQGYDLKLLTRHEGNIDEALTIAKLDRTYFSSVIKVEKHQRKSDFIEVTSSIFIDNEFPQRFDVQFNALTPSFDLEQVEFISLHQIN